MQFADVSKIVRWETNNLPVDTGSSRELSLQSQSLLVCPPAAPGRELGGWVWTRPVAVLVTQDGQTERIPIHNVTRIAILALAGLGAGATMLAWLVGRIAATLFRR